MIVVIVLFVLICFGNAFASSFSYIGLNKQYFQLI